MRVYDAMRQRMDIAQSRFPGARSIGAIRGHGMIGYAEIFPGLASRPDPIYRA